jgi:hypothetical protein
LYDKYYNKTTGDWIWESQGPPGGSTPVGLSAIYQPTVRPLVVFVDGSDGNLYDKYYDAGWNWQSQGNPGVPVYGTSAVFDASSGQIVDFVAGHGNGHLYSLTGNGTAGTWKDHGTPTSTSKTQYCCATVYQPTSHPVTVFLTASDGHLHDRYWNGSTWVWEDQGLLPAGIDSVPSAVDDPTNGQIHVFLTGTDGHLYDRYWDGSGWTWAYFGTPAPGVFVSAPSAVFQPTSHPLACFVVGNNGHLYDIYYNSSTWVWEDQGIPPGDIGINALLGLSSVLRADVPTLQVFMFGTSSGSLYDKYWNGSKWVWENQGHP